MADAGEAGEETEDRSLIHLVFSNALFAAEVQSLSGAP